MHARKQVLVAGATGLVGSAVVQHLGATDCAVVATSKHTSVSGQSYQSVPLDLRDRAAGEAALASISDITHLVYTALYEQPTLVSG